MLWLTPEALERDRAELDSAALVTPGASALCSATDWALSANEALHGRRPLFAARRDEAWALLSVGERNRHVGTVIHALEADWGFACPLLGPDPSAAAALVTDMLDASPVDWGAVLLTGLSEHHVPAAAEPLSRFGQVAVRDGIRSDVTSLEGGEDGFWARRSSNFRKALKKQDRLARSGGVDFTLVTANADDVVSRAIAIDSRSWKSRNHESIFAVPRYVDFYRRLLRRSEARGGLRAAFARFEGRDVAFAFGAVLGTVFRGFQLGYDGACERFGLGNLVQLELIRRLAAEGTQHYDLGMTMAYKERWCDRRIELHSVIAIRQRS